MNENLTGRFSGNEVFDKSLENLPPSVIDEILNPITASGVENLAVIYGWVDGSPESVDPRG
jgi:hypothetical protein